MVKVDRPLATEHGKKLKTKRRAMREATTKLLWWPLSR